MDSLINHFRKIKIIGKTLHYCNPVSKPPFSKNPKRPFVEKIENEIFLLY